MEEARAVVASMHAEEQRLLALRERTVTEAATKAQRTFLLGTVIAFSILTGVFAALHHQLKRRTEAEQRLAEANAQLETRVRSRTEALEVSERKFRRIFETANEGIWILDDNGRVQLANPRMIDLLGYSEPELLGRSKLELAAPDEAAKIREHFERRKRGVAEQFEVRFRHKDGNDVWALVAARPIFDDGQYRGTLDMITDITDRKSMELELENAQEKLRRHAATLEERVTERTAQLQETVFHLQSFSYSITHDMRAPLRALTGYAHILLEEHAHRLPIDARELLDRIGNAATRLDQLIQDVLNYSRLTRGELPLEKVELSKLLKDIVHEYPDFKERASHIHIDCEPTWIRANPAALTQVVSNLLRNALTFVATNVTPRVRMWCESRNGKVRVWFEDNGIGIEAEYQKRIWDVFQRLHSDDAYPGTGIGLAIVKKAIERMGGAVGVESEPGRGSRFWFELPRLEKDSPPEK